MTSLRPYQIDIYRRLQTARQLHRNVAAVMPTGSGKTVLSSTVVAHCGVPCVVIAHRQELVSQISLALAANGVLHAIMAPNNVIKHIVRRHVKECGRSYFDPTALCTVAGVDTLIRREYPGADQVGLWVLDECHHLQADNKWGRAVSMFPNARGLGVTATLCRADGRGLGRDTDGLIDTWIEGPSTQELIESGYLSQYRIVAPPSTLSLIDVKTASNGDYSSRGLSVATKRSSVMGDVVQHYKRWADGKLGVTFAPSIEVAEEITSSYQSAGVPATLVTANTAPEIRAEVIDRFRARRILQLVNVDIFGEGFDLPAIECVSLARATQSFALYRQQVGRALRPFPGKGKALILDHVGNVARHGLPDAPHEWTLNRRERQSRGASNEGVIPLRTCLNPECFGVYEAVYRVCPYCGWVHKPGSRLAPEYVDGDLIELDDIAIEALRVAVRKVDRPSLEILRSMQQAGHAYPAAKGAANRHADRQEAQTKLRDTIALWAGYQRAARRPDSESYRRFYYTFGVDVLSAQALGRRDAETLERRVRDGC